MGQTSSVTCSPREPSTYVNYPVAAVGGDESVRVRERSGYLLHAAPVVAAVPHQYPILSLLLRLGAFTALEAGGWKNWVHLLLWRLEDGRIGCIYCFGGWRMEGLFAQEVRGWRMEGLFAQEVNP